MKFRPFLTILLLAQQPMAHGQDAAALLKKGRAALDEGLWEVAEPHFREALADHSAPHELKPEIMLRLAETLIREGNASEALDLLGQSVLAGNPETPFWKALALAGQLRFNEAVSLLQPLVTDPAAPHRIEAGFTRASLQLSLGQPDAALETLAGLVPESDATTVVRIRLYQVEIFIDLGRIEDARRAMPEKSASAKEDRPLRDFLEAQLQLKEGHPDVAEAGFQQLINQALTGRPGLSLTHRHMAAVGLADAIQAQGDAEAASKSLLDFIQAQPDSPLLDAMFSRILEWLPEKPAATDPVLERLKGWIPDATLRFAPTLRTPAVSLNPADADTTAVSAWPAGVEAVEQKELKAYSLFTRAVGLHRIGTPLAQADAKNLLTRLRTEHPEHFLNNRALYQMARWSLDGGSADLAFSILETLRETAKSPTLKGQSAFLEALASYQNGDPAKAARLFEEAAKMLPAPDAKLARLHEAISLIRSGGPNKTTLVQLEGNPPDKELEANLELERTLSTTPPEAARTALDGFLTRFPDHPRAPEARLAAAEAALASPTPDLSFATAQLDTLAAAAEKGGTLPPARIALARLQIADLSNSPTTTALAQSLIETYPNQPEAAAAKFTLGRNLFKAGNYNPARLALEDLAVKDTDKARAQAAFLLAARAASLGTEASKKEAVVLYDKAIESGGPVTDLANLEKFRHLIDMSRSEEAAKGLEAWIAKLPADDALQLPAGLLLGEALFNLGSSDPHSLSRALAVYDKLLAKADAHPGLFNLLQFRRGETLELMPDEKDPSKTRGNQAFQAYYSVLETTTPPAEWEYFERCGFRAFAMLQKAGRWQAAINVAKKIASFKGPRAEEASNLANRIKLEQQMYEDD